MSMPFNLHPKAKQKIIERLAVTVAAAEVYRSESGGPLVLCDQDRLVGALTQLDAVLDANERKQLVASGVAPLGRFLPGAMLDILDAGAGSNAAEGRMGFLSAAGVTNARQLAQTLIESYESLPWRFRYIVPLPRLAPLEGAVGDSYALSDDVVLRKLTSGEIDKLTLGNTLAERLGISPPVVEVDSYAVIQEVDGFTMRHDDCFDVEAIASTVKQFLGLGLAVGIFAQHGAGKRAKLPGLVFHQSVTRPGTMSCTTMDQPDAEVTASVGVPYRIDAAMRTNGPEYHEWATESRKMLHRIGFAFRTRDMRLLTAGEWYINSHAGSLLLQLVQVTTTLEILLGGTKAQAEQVGLVRLLANRCGYLLGATPAQREEIVEEVEHLYDARSRIVHEGHNRVDEDQLAAGRRLVQRVIGRELQFVAGV